jgi:hypothetical protein
LEILKYSKADLSLVEDAKLRNLLKTYLKGGSTLKEAKAKLIDSGYSLAKIDAAATDFSNNRIRDSSRPTPYSYFQIVILSANIGLGFFYHYVFFFSTAFILLQILMSGETKKPLTKGETSFLGFSGQVGELFDFWVQNPSILGALGFLGLGVAGVYIYDTTFAAVCFIFAAAWYLGNFFFQK